VDVTLHPHSYTFLAGVGYKSLGNGSLTAK
jgi:hypothetical protein